jgi:hypothetical protein
LSLSPRFGLQEFVDIKLEEQKCYADSKSKDFNNQVHVELWKHFCFLLAGFILPSTIEYLTIELLCLIASQIHLSITTHQTKKMLVKSYSANTEYFTIAKVVRIARLDYDASVIVNFSIFFCSAHQLNICNPCMSTGSTSPLLHPESKVCCSVRPQSLHC